MLGTSLVSLCLLAGALGAQTEPAQGTWRAWLDSPGGELPFGLELENTGAGLRAFLINGEESIPVPEVALDGERLTLSMPHYDSAIEALVSDDGQALEGHWKKRAGAERWAELAFHARAGSERRFRHEPSPPEAGRTVAGRWAVDFEHDELPAVAVFESAPSGSGNLLGTFLTATGDYRFLAGSFEGDRLRLSVFDGAHAFLFDARLQPDGSLRGDFWSRDSWHETWTARRDEQAEVVDAFQQTTWDERVSLAELVFPDLEGQARSLADPEFAGKAIVVQLFGSWCPNCHDETAYLVELHERYAHRGLVILGLAFELTGDFERDARQVRIHGERYGVTYPMFVVGTADKERATAAFPAIDRLRSYPTTIFMTGDGVVRSVHSGFAGPATGDEHTRLRAEFEGLIEELLTSPPADDASTWRALVESGPWLNGVAALRFEDGPEGERRVQRVSIGTNDGVPRWEAVRIVGDAIWAGERGLRFDGEVGVLLDPRWEGVRWAPAGREAAFLEQRGYAGPEAWVRALRDADARVRREALVLLARERHGGARLPEAIPLLADPSPAVCQTATWALGHCAEGSAREALLKQLDRPRAALRRETVRALGQLSVDEELLARLETMSSQDPDPLVRRAAREVVAHN